LEKRRRWKEEEIKRIEVENILIEEYAKTQESRKKEAQHQLDVAAELRDAVYAKVRQYDFLLIALIVSWRKR
jgi:hypothetical protein